MEKKIDGSEKAKPVKKQNVPAADIDFGNVITTVSTKWKANDWLTLRWLTAATFESNATTYGTTLEARLTSGAIKPQISKSLENLDKQMDEHLSYVKGYITDKFKKNDAESYYPSFGIEHKYNRYAFPRDQNRRLTSLTLMMDGIQKNGFVDKEYGLDFWTNIRDLYKELLKQSTTLDGGISVKVGDKNVLKNDLKKAVNALIFAIKANYPDTFKEELRDWGFQKEKY
jgi:hypothetical protein